MNKLFKAKKRLLGLLLAVMTVCTMFPTVSASAAESYDGGWAMMSSSRTVYSSSSLSSSIGSISAYEGITVLNVLSNNVYYVQYQISSSPYYKRGYVQGGVNTAALGYTCVASVSRSTTVYYGPNAGQYEWAGSVSSGELVSVIAANSPWAYIEYDSPSGRKRGYVEISALTMYEAPSWMPNLYINSSPDSYVDNYQATSTTPVLSGPSSKYPAIGSISSQDGVLTVWYSQEAAGQPGYDYCYVQYTDSSTGKLKSGFVLKYVS